jgi:hypothetical protein
LYRLSVYYLLSSLCIIPLDISLQKVITGCTISFESSETFCFLHRIFFQFEFGGWEGMGRKGEETLSSGQEREAEKAAR